MRSETETRARLKELEATAAKAKRAVPLSLTMQIVTLKWVLGEADLFGDDPFEDEEP